MGGPARPMIPNIAHFVFGLREQDEPFHLLHYRLDRVVPAVRSDPTDLLPLQAPPMGPYWDRVRPHCSRWSRSTWPRRSSRPTTRPGLVPERVPVRPPRRLRPAGRPDRARGRLRRHRHGLRAAVPRRPVRGALCDRTRRRRSSTSRTGELRPSLCNALLMSEPGSGFARRWRDEMAAALNGTWSNHSGFLAEELSRRDAGPGTDRAEGDVLPVRFGPGKGLDGTARERRTPA